MQNTSRIPDLPNKSVFAMERWWYKMYLSGMLFHPDDRPEDIVDIVTGVPFFTPEECNLLNDTINRLFEYHGDKVYDIGIKYFYKAMNYEPDYKEA